MRKTQCPNCFAVIEMDDSAKVKDTVKCPRCKAILEVIKKLPLTLDWGEDPSARSSRRLLKRRG